MSTFRNATKVSNDLFIADFGYPKKIARGDQEFAAYESQFSFLQIGQTAIHGQEGDSWDVVDGFPLLDEAKAAKLVEINRVCQEKLVKLTSTYPNSEVLTFDQQKAEAMAYLADDSSQCPMLQKLAEKRGIEMSDIAQRVIRKATVFSEASGSLMGQRQRYEDMLDAATSIDDVKAIHVKYV